MRRARDRIRIPRARRGTLRNLPRRSRTARARRARAGAADGPGRPPGKGGEDAPGPSGRRVQVHPRPGLLDVRLTRGPGTMVGHDFTTRTEKAKRAGGPGVPILAIFVVSGCMMVGPDYRRPEAPVAPDWIARGAGSIAPSAEPIGPWWESFGDPVLTDLIVEAYRQNPSLQAAGVRVLEGQARRGIAIGTLFPQMQNAVGAYARNVASESLPPAPPERGFNQLLAGFDVAWELDVWGKFRRGIESSDAELLAAVADYDDVLVSLLAEVAASSIGIRTAQDELDVARQNAQLQRASFKIATLRAQHGAVTDVDPAQAATLLHATEAQIPFFEAQIDEQASTLSALLGVPPRRVEELVGQAPAQIPNPPPAVATGIPADLLRRRPDVRRSDRLLAAQSAKIGIAKADLFPHLSLVGSINLHSDYASKFFERRTFKAFTGPTCS